MSQRRPVSRHAAESKAEQADASQSQRVRRLMRESHRHGSSQNLDDSDDAAAPVVERIVMPRARVAHGGSAFMNPRSSREQHPSGSSPDTLQSSLPQEETRRPRQARPPAFAGREQLRRPHSQGTIESSSQVSRSSARRSQTSSTPEQRPASAGHIRRQQEVNQSRRQHVADQARPVLDADARSRRSHEAHGRRSTRQDVGNISQPSDRQEMSPASSQVGLRASREAPDFRISIGGPALQVAVEGMEPLVLPMPVMLDAMDDEHLHPMIAMTRRIEIATQLVRLLEEQSLEERILRAVIEESSQEQLRAALEQSIAEQQSHCTVPPVKEGVMESLPHVVVIKEDLLDETNSQCSICLEKYTLGSRATRILCGHLFCTNCLTGWLNSANSCPVCRYELPTERADFEVGRKDRMKGRKAFLKEGDLMMMSGPALKRLVSVLDISTEGCIEKADLLGLLRASSDVQISLDRSGVCYAEADFGQLKSQAMCALLHRHGITLPPPRFHKDEQTMRVEVVRRFKAAGLLEPACSPLAHERVEPESRPATPELEATSWTRARTSKLRSTRRGKSDTKAKNGRVEQMKVQGLRMSSVAGSAEQAWPSKEAHPSSSSLCAPPDPTSGSHLPEGLVSDAEAEDIFLSAEASTSNRPNSRGNPFPARSSNAARCWEPQKSKVRSLSERTLGRASDSQGSSPHAETMSHTRSMANSEASRAPTGYWFRRTPSLTPGQEVHKREALSSPAQKATLLGRPSKFVQRVRRSFKFGGV